MQVVWEADTADFHKRKRAARACADCQKRKKRCHHTFANRDEAASHLQLQSQSQPPQQQGHNINAGSEEENAGEGGSDQQQQQQQQVVASSSISSSQQQQQEQQPHEPEIRFIGNTNPESVLTDLHGGVTGGAEGTNAQSIDVGVWLDPTQRIAADVVDEDQRQGADEILSSIQGSALPRQGAIRQLNPTLQRYLQEVGVFRVLPRSTQNLLISNYFECIHNVLPIIAVRPFLKALREGTASIFLIHAVCLIASKTQDAESYLRLSEDGPIIRPLQFAKTLYMGLDAAMKADLETSQMAKIQILALLSLHNDGPGGIEDASLHLAHAIHHAQSAGYHMDTPGRSENDRYKKRLFWCLWSMDKVNACIGGRPIMIADQDIGTNRPAPAQGEERAFDAWMALSDVLAQVIGYYRPAPGKVVTGWEDNFPTFEEISSELSQGVLEAAHRNILELYYHVIAILACRAGQKSTISYSRRVSAASRIESILSSPRAVNVAPLPIVSYAASLSMTVAYRQLRDGNTNEDQWKAWADLQSRGEILQDLSSRWWTADAMAKLARKALTSLQQPRSESSKIMTMMEDSLEPCTFSARIERSRAEGKEMEQNALDVLSSVAEAHAYNAQPQAQPYLHQWSENADDGRGEQLDDQNSTGMQFPPVSNSQLLDFNMSNFQDLDAFFGDFVDLSMPTLFQDPLFEGANFFDLPETME